MYKKTTEFEYAKILSKKYEVKESYFWIVINMGIKGKQYIKLIK